jgi:tRNA 2-thiocytidine biosynthesis protein TtcA
MEAGPSLYAEAPSSVSFNKLRKRLIRNVRQAIEDFAMVAPAAAASGKRPRWLVALSGGKDSYGLLALLDGPAMARHAAGRPDRLQSRPGPAEFPKHILPDYLTAHGVPHRIEYRDTYSVVTSKVPEGATYCALCSRLRRGNLYRIAREEGCEALVLGHHRDDILETFFLNFFHGGRLEAMPPKLLNDDGDVMVLRPMAYCAEEDLARFAEALKFPIIPCDLCGSQDGLQRNAMKLMIGDIERRMPGRKDSMIRALSNTRPSHLLDRSLFDFAALAVQSNEADT